MRNRTLALLVVVVLTIVYLGTGTPVTGQVSAQGAPLAPKDKVTLIYRQVSQDRVAPQTECVVVELQGQYVRCSARPEEAAHWINLAFVVEIIKHQK